jgi:preprotein translocase subunit SecE
MGSDRDSTSAGTTRGRPATNTRGAKDDMGKEKNAAFSLLLREMFNLHIYKRSQGRIARQVTFAAFFVGVMLAAWRLSVFGSASSHLMEFAVPGGLALVGTWISFRLVNMPSFADFLIAVEAEMNKVSWPTRNELWRSALVVILLIIFLSAVLFGYDVFWRTLLSLLRIVHGS